MKHRHARYLVALLVAVLTLSSPNTVAYADVAEPGAADTSTATDSSVSDSTSADSASADSAPHAITSQLSPTTPTSADSDAPQVDTSAMTAGASPDGSEPVANYRYSQSISDCSTKHRTVGYTHDGWVMNRYAYCQIRAVRFLITSGNGMPAEHVDVLIATVVSAAINDTRWRWTMQVVDVNWDGAGANLSGGFYMLVSATAPGVQNALTTSTQSYLRLGPSIALTDETLSGTYSAQAGTTVPSTRGNTYLVADGSWSLWTAFDPDGSLSPSKPLALGPTYAELQNPATKAHFTALRCDSSTAPNGRAVYYYAKACVFDDVMPTLTLSQSDSGVGASAKFIAATISSKGAPTLLSRNEDQAHEQQNRNDALDICAGKAVGTMTDPSCDEYPFAMSGQGNHDSPTMSDAAWVPASANSLAGSRLGAKVQGDRIANGDRFKVVITK